MRKCRGTSTIRYEILESIKSGNHHQTKIAKKANVRYNYFKKYLKELLDAGLVRLGEPSSHGAEKVYLTSKGVEYVELSHMLKLMNLTNRR